LNDQIICLTSRKTLPTELPDIRRVEYRDPETGKVYVFLTNHRRWAAQTVADIYKSRWGVELYFRWIKQHLKIRSFLGHSMNAVASQIFVALCVHLLVAFQKFVSRSAMGIQHVMRLVQLSLFQRKPLANLIRSRKYDPPDPQMPLRLRAA
jgi:IS4 transposase